MLLILKTIILAFQGPNQSPPYQTDGKKLSFKAVMIKTQITNQQNLKIFFPKSRHMPHFFFRCHNFKIVNKHCINVYFTLLFIQGSKPQFALLIIINLLKLLPSVPPKNDHVFVQHASSTGGSMSTDRRTVSSI